MTVDVVDLLEMIDIKKDLAQRLTVTDAAA